MSSNFATGIKPYCTDAYELSKILNVICNQTRMRLICLLLQGERCVNEITETLALPQNLVSHHLGVLRNAGLIDGQRDEKDSRWIYYSINRQTLAALNACYLGFFAADRTQPWCEGCGNQPGCCPEYPALDLQSG